MNRHIAAVGLLIIGLAGSCFVAGQRARVESRNHAVEIVLDYSEVQEVAAASGMPVLDVARRFKNAGATSIAIAENTFGEVLDNHTVTPYDATHFAIAGNEAERIVSHLRMALPRFSDKIISTSLPKKSGQSYTYLTLKTPIPMDYLEQIPVGISQEAVDTAREAGLIPIARLVNYPGVSPGSIEAILDNVESRNVRTVIFSGDQVLGFKEAVKDTAKAFQKTGLHFGQLEFAKQKGERSIAATVPGSVVGVHGISATEMMGMSIPSIVERFQKAVRERGVRILYVRMYHSACDDLVKADASYINAIARGVQRDGFALKASRPMQELAVPRFVRMIAGAGVAAGAILLITSLVDLSALAVFLWSIALILVCVGLPAVGSLGQKAIALLSALVFPVLAVVNVTRGAPDSPKTMAMPYLRTIGRFAGAVITVAAGGMLIVGLLSGRDFMLRVDQFSGVKLAHLLPVLTVALLYGVRVAWFRGTWKAQKERFLHTLSEIASNPMLFWQVGLSAALLILVTVMVTRSGNDSGIGVSSVELKVRTILDQVLYVRPRTKEILVGYPALMVGIALALKGRRSWSAPFMVVGSIGLISALNTFCHIHSPIALSLLRVANGAIVGGLIGLVLIWIIRRQVA